MLITKYFYFISNDPLSRFPQGGKALNDAPSPLGEGWEGGKKYSFNYCFIHDSRYSYNNIHHFIFPLFHHYNFHHNSGPEILAASAGFFVLFQQGT